MWRGYYESQDPFSRTLPGDWENLTLFQKSLVLRCLRPDRLESGVTTVVEHRIGQTFTRPPPFDLVATFDDSSATAPLVFVLSSGTDPSKEVYALAEKMGFNSPDRLANISLGQGQGVVAENAIREAIDKGTWVMLQNCHLLAVWLPTLQKIVDEINPETTDPQFRLWLTSMPSPQFPVSILQNGVKMTIEPPKGIRANLEFTYRPLAAGTYFEDCNQPENLKKMMFGLSMFHAVVRERRKFGAMGWNVKYDFTDSDLDISARQLKMFLNLYDDVPLVALKYLVGQLNYGGRVTDFFDLRATQHILKGFFCEMMIDDEYKFDSEGKYHAPALGSDVQDYLNYIEEMPKEDSIEVFGLHANVNITAAIKESNEFLGTLLSIQPRDSGGSGGVSRDDVVDQLARDIYARLPAEFDVEEASEKYPVTYDNSMNTVLVQELVRFNKLLRVLKKTLVDVQKAIKGLVVMSTELEAMTNSMYNGMVPQLWIAVAYPSLKPLASWVNDFTARLDTMKDWLQNGAPSVYWLSGFFFTQSFLTGTLQNYARKHQVPIDLISYDFEVRTDLDKDSPDGPEDGSYIYGLFLEGARWDHKDQVIAEPFKRQLWSVMPVIHLKPCISSKIPTDQLVYPCPLYKTSARRGVLSTTGRSTNFVLAINLISKLEETHWVKRGVALLSQLDD